MHKCGKGDLSTTTKKHEERRFLLRRCDNLRERSTLEEREALKLNQLGESHILQKIACEEATEQRKG